MLPKPVIERQGRVFVLRDDLIEGGTKRRILPALLNNASEFVYASPAYGYAQIALAHACREAGYGATIFVAKRKELHERTREAIKAGAKIVQVPYGYLSNIQAKAKAYAEATGAHLMPFGIDVPEMKRGIQSLATELDIEPKEVWTVAGSGTLTRALQDVWKDAQFYTVRIGAGFEGLRAKVLQAPEKFEENAKVKPPFPSCSNYDAKAWRFIEEHASNGALFWNVAA